MRSGRSPSLLLELDLAVALPDPPPRSGAARLLNHGHPALREVIDRLDRAGRDPRVAGLVVRTGGHPPPLAVAQELHAALAAFAATGRPTVAWAETFGEFGKGTASYLLATGAPEIWLQPSGEVGLTGIAAEATFARALVDRWGAEAQFGARHEYKNAPNVATERGYTDAHREAMDRLVTSSLQAVVEEIARARGLDPTTVRELVDQAPLTASAASAAGLVDHLGYRDQVYAAMRSRLPGSELRYLHRLGTRPAERLRAAARRRARHVAVIDVAGIIRGGRSGRGLLGSAAGSDSVTAALRVATEDAAVAAVVLRVDSPGGSYVASDAMWRAGCAVREAGKPLVASMGRVAASGGYFVSMCADRILVQPTTITGSIGVVAGKLVVAETLRRQGIDHDAVAAGARARLGSARVGFDLDQRTALEAWLDEVYRDFTTKVAAARGLSQTQVDAVARGRVWTGADALERGLVDEVGGLHDALARARTLAGLPEDASARPIPAPRMLDRFSRPRSSADPRAAAADVGIAADAHRLVRADGVDAGSWIAGWGCWAEIAAALGLPSAGAVLAPNLTLSA